MPIALVSLSSAVALAANALSLGPPAGLDAGKLDLALVAISDSIADSVIAPLADGGAFTTIFAANANASGSPTADHVLARKTGAASPGPIAVTWNGYARNALGLRMAWSGVDLGAPIEAQSAALTQGQVSGSPATPSLTVPGITTVTDGAVAVAYIVAQARSAGSPAGFGAVAGWTTAFAGDAYWGAATVTVGIFHRTLATAGPSGSVTADLQNLSQDSNYNWLGGMIALSPDGSLPPAVMRSRANFLGL